MARLGALANKTAGTDAFGLSNYDQLQAETGWEPLVSGEEGVARCIDWYAAHRERWIGRVDWIPTGGTVPIR